MMHVLGFLYCQVGSLYICSQLRKKRLMKKGQGIIQFDCGIYSRNDQMDAPKEQEYNLVASTGITLSYTRIY